MNRDHALGAVGGGSAFVWLATVLQAWQAVTPTVAEAESGLLILAAGAIWALVSRYLPAATPAAPATPEPSPGH